MSAATAVPALAKGADVLTDAEAVERFQGLFAEHYRRVYAYAMSMAGRQLADEVVSEVFLVAWRRLADVPTPALPWLLTVTRHVVRSQFRAAARQQSIDAELRAWVTEAELAAPGPAPSGAGHGRCPARQHRPGAVPAEGAISMSKPTEERRARRHPDVI